MTRVVLWAVTLLRIVLVPVFVVLASRAQEVARGGGDPGGLQLAVIGVLVAMGLSDVIDGWIARRFDLATQIGAIIDAAADKLVQVALVAFFALSQGPAYAALPFGFLALLVGRDLVLGGGLLFARSRSVTIRIVHRPHGRASSILVFVVLAWIATGLPERGMPWLLGFTSLLILGSSLAYLATGIQQARDALRRAA